MNKESKAVYIHIPFCKNICSYCNFSKVYYQEELVSMYLDALEKEIKDTMWSSVVKTLYIGGGTPSSLSMSNLKKLFDIIKRFKFELEYEFTFELNLSDINLELLELLKQNKVNRLSIGIQSFDKRKLKIMKREAEYKDAQSKINLCRELGFDNISVDLIYGFQTETKRILKKDLKKIVKLKPDHISTYSLIIENNTELKINKISPINDEIDYNLYKIIQKYLRKHKFIQYEISNFKKLKKESHHNLVYWNNEEYYGFGLGAAGYLNGVRYTNTKNITKYIEKEFLDTKEILSKKEVMDYELILGLRKIKGINLADFKFKYDLDLYEEYKVDNLLKNNYLKEVDGRVFVPQNKLYLLNEILVKLL